MENETPDRKKLLLLTLPLIGVIIFSAFLQVFVLSRHDEIVNLVDGLGGGFIFAYVLIQFLAIVIAPIGGAFIWIMMIAVLGPAKGLLLGYFVMTPAYFVNFILARRFGRNFVVKLVGKKALDKIDDISKNAGVGTLWVLKIFQGGYFDYISYAAGLVKSISLRSFALINIIGGIPATLLAYFIMTRVEGFALQMAVLYLTTGILIVISIAWTKRKNKSKGDLTKVKEFGIK